MLQLVSKALRLLNGQKAAGRSFREIFEKGYSIASTEIICNIRQYVDEIHTVIDVGANQGQFAIAASKGYPQANIYSFEPLPETFLVLKKNVGEYDRIKSFNTALGSEQGVIDFYKNNHSHASSALPVSTFQKNQLPETSITQKIQVPVERLDRIADKLVLEAPVLLKLDVQGFEKQVLEGSSGIINKIDFLVFEASFIQMYDGETLFNELHDYVQSCGFELVAPVGALQNKKGQFLQLDMLYRRSSE